MTAFGKLFRTTAFKLSLVYLLIFSAGAAAVLLAVGWNVEHLVNDQIGATIDAEIKGLAEQYQQGRLEGLLDVIEHRSRLPGSSLYLLTNYAGQPLAGNIATLPAAVLDHPGAVEIFYQRLGETQARHRALAQIFVLPGGFHLLIGRDLADRIALRQILARAFLISLLSLTAIGTLGGLVVARRVLRRVDAMNASAVSIMAGDLSRRLPLAGTGDELDRLVINLNSMLDRIGELMSGLKEVSDNIAHDLKTPLTRLRNRTEQALCDTASPAEHRAALEHVITESDRLIATFNALLMIARAEAGASGDEMMDFDAAETACASGELYEPLAEELGVDLRIETDQRLIVHGSRELIGQTIANLIDNALKYGTPILAAPGTKPQISVQARRKGGFVELSVADQGSGIPVADQVRVLQRFVRLESARSQPGSGLGLALATAVAHLHGGSLKLEDCAPGLRVTVALPLAKSQLASLS